MDGLVRELQRTAQDKAERYVVLALGEISLILAQREIKTLEPVLDIKPRTAEADMDNAAGVLSLQDGMCAVYACDADLNCLERIPMSHRICAIMNHRSQPYAISCAEVRLLPQAALSVRQVPKPLRSPTASSPIQSLIVSAEELLLGTTAAALFAHLSRNVNAEIIPFDERARRARK